MGELSVPTYLLTLSEDNLIGRNEKSSLILQSKISHKVSEDNMLSVLVADPAVTAWSRSLQIKKAPPILETL